MIDDFVATPIPYESYRHAISSSEEVWVCVCAKFFERHGTFDWFVVPQRQAFKEMMQDSKGTMSPRDLEARIGMLYKGVGVK